MLQLTILLRIYLILLWGYSFGGIIPKPKHKKVKVTLNNYRASKVNTNVNPTETTKKKQKKLNPHAHGKNYSCTTFTALKCQSTDVTDS